MNGPEHYREAERLIATIPDQTATAERMNLRESTLVAAIANTVALAQVHATLALAAATGPGMIS